MMRLLLQLRNWICLISSISVFAISAENAVPTNKMCPVEPQNPALAKYGIVYNGQEYNFCCADCVKIFKLDPERYSANSSGATESKAKVSTFSKSNTEPAYVRILQSHQMLLIDFMALLVLTFLAQLSTRRWKSQTASGSAWRMALANPVSRMVFAASLMIPILLAQILLFAAKKEDPRKNVSNQGLQAVPQAMALEPEAAPHLSVTYYRGNDERNEKLFNNGNYRTATFQLSLVDETGRQLVPGDAVSGKTIKVKLQIIRARNTPDGFFAMIKHDTTWLTQDLAVFSPEGVEGANKVYFRECEPMQRWEAECAVPIMVKSSLMIGTFYLFFHATPHYGIHYSLRVHEGILADDSTIWMGAIAATPKSSELPKNEWLSHIPLPFKSERGPQDPKLLGLDDYEKYIKK
jgi:YHS domain-containing protein